jgi:hypothetical protein
MKATILQEDWEFNVLGVYNYRRPGMLKYYFDFVIENHANIPGDLLESGVFRGRSLLGMAMLLKELGSDKVVYGYDSWSGFPPIYHEADDYAQWQRLHESGRISSEHYAKVLRNQEFRSLDLDDKQKVNAANASLSGNFSACSKESVEARAKFLNLDNIRLVQGTFEETMVSGHPLAPKLLMAVLMDSDLYASYMTTLPFSWPRLSRGGYIFLDEYYSLKFPGALIATDEFFADKKDKPQKHKQIDGDFERWFVRKIVGD